MARGLDTVGTVELSVQHPETGERQVVARRRVRPPGAVAQRLLTEVRERLAQEAARPAAERDPASYDELRGLLYRIRPGARHNEWQRLALEVDGVFLQKARRAFLQMHGLSEAHLAEGTSDEFDSWYQDYRRLIFPRTLGHAGYGTALDSHDDGWVWDCVTQVTDALAAQGYEAFVVSGTLLGVIREGGLVPHDYDVDMALMLHARSLDELADEWQELRGRLAQAGVLDESYDKTGLRLYKLRLPNGFKCDLFPAWEIDGRVSIWPHTLEIDPASVLPLASREVQGVEVRVPQVPEEVLTCNYGPGWRTPDPFFEFDWPAAKQRFSAFLAATENSSVQPPAGSLPRLWVHCGGYKTGSTRIQELVYEQREELAAQGWLYPAAGLRDDDPEVGRRHSRLVYDHHYHPETWPELVTALVAEIRASGAQNVLLSTEAWSRDYAPALLGLVVDALREAEVIGEVCGVLYVRNRLACARSLYREYVRRRKVRYSFSSFVRANQVWLDPLAISRDLRTALRGGTLLVRPYDSAGDVAEDFAQVVGLPLSVDEGARRPNSGLDAVDIEAFRQLNRIAPHRSADFPGVAAVAGAHLVGLEAYTERLDGGELESSAAWQREFAEENGWTAEEVARLVEPDREPGPDVVDLAPLLRGVCEGWLARTSSTEPVAEKHPHPRVHRLYLLLADLDHDSFRLRGYLVPAGDWPDGDRLVLVDRLGEHAVEHGLDSQGFARHHVDDLTDAITYQHLTHARFVSGFTSLAPGERIDLLYVDASGQRTLIATVRLPLG